MEFPENVISELMKFELSGGQIQNIKRKYMTDKLLFSNQDCNLEKLKCFISQETSLRQLNRNTIGF